MNLQTKADILRRHETYCYQICYYFMKSDEPSLKAAREALLEVIRDPVFFGLSHEEQEKKIRLFAVRSTMRIKVGA